MQMQDIFALTILGKAHITSTSLFVYLSVGGCKSLALFVLLRKGAFCVAPLKALLLKSTFLNSHALLQVYYFIIHQIFL
jgi:hypothetical protein